MPQTKPPASDTLPVDIRSLKEITFRSTYISDVGRIRDGSLACSALWGNFRPSALPVPRYSSGPVQLWHASDLADSPYIDSNLITRGEIFTVSSPTAFDTMDPERSSSINIETRSRSFAFRRVSPANGQQSRGGAVVEAAHCSDLTDACAFVTTPRRMVSELPFGILAAIAAAGLFGGLALAYLIIRRRITARQTIQQRLIFALTHREIELVYQPLRRIATLDLVGFEALSRWRPPGDEEIPPTVFVPIAHSLDLSTDLFRYVLCRALTDLGPALREHRNLYVSINAEPIDMEQENIVRYISSITSDFGVRPGQIHIEITEREELSSELAKSNMQSLSSLGYGFLIDDFGTGSANFSHLAQSPFRGIKIDRMFVAATTENSPLGPVLQGMYSIAQELGLDIVVEGVETEQQELLLRHIAPEAIGQGWHYGRPLSATETLIAIGGR